LVFLLETLLSSPLVHVLFGMRLHLSQKRTRSGQSREDPGWPDLKAFGAKFAEYLDARSPEADKKSPHIRKRLSPSSSVLPLGESSPYCMLDLWALALDISIVPPICAQFMQDLRKRGVLRALHGPLHLEEGATYNAGRVHDRDHDAVGAHDFTVQLICLLKGSTGGTLNDRYLSKASESKKCKGLKDVRQYAGLLVPPAASSHNFASGISIRRSR
jgi:hypothetical protein